MILIIREEKVLVTKALFRIHRYIIQGEKKRIQASKRHPQQYGRRVRGFGLNTGEGLLLLTWHQEATAPWHPWEQGTRSDKAKAKYCYSLEAMSEISRNRVLFTSPYILKKT